jgi:hypothetical protein
MNSARSRSYTGWYGPVGSSAIGPGRGATFEANPTKGTLVAPARFHSCYANPSVSRTLLINSLGGPAVVRILVV